MKELIAALLIWIGTHTGYNVDIPHPEVILTPNVCTYWNKPENCGVAGMYSDESNIIVLNSAFDEESDRHISMLLHEVVHHVQNLNGTLLRSTVDERCAVEREAYLLQGNWLIERGTVAFRRSPRVVAEVICRRMKMREKAGGI